MLVEKTNLVQRIFPVFLYLAEIDEFVASGRLGLLTHCEWRAWQHNALSPKAAGCILQLELHMQGIRGIERLPVPRHLALLLSRVAVGLARDLVNNK